MFNIIGIQAIRVHLDMTCHTCHAGVLRVFIVIDKPLTIMVVSENILRVFVTADRCVGGRRHRSASLL